MNSELVHRAIVFFCRKYQPYADEFPLQVATPSRVGDIYLKKPQYSYRYWAWILTVLCLLITNGSCVGSLLVVFYNPGVHLEPWKIILQIMFLLFSAIGLAANVIVYKYSDDIYIAWNRVTRLFRQIQCKLCSFRKPVLLVLRLS